MKDCPNIYSADYIAREHCVSAGLPDGRWVLARPMGFSGLCLGLRLRRAWMVFTGRADVLTWEGGQ